MPQKPVVFIPGFPASELIQRSTGRTVYPPSLGDLANSDRKRRLVELLSGPDPQRDLVAGEPIRRLLEIAKQAESLYDILRLRFGYTIDGGNNFRAIGWDWRHAVDDSVVLTAFANAITTLSASGSRVVVILHSTGGLVFRRLLETQPALVQHIEHVLSFGVPWAGNLKAFRYLTQGAAIGPFFLRLSASQTRTVMRVAQAAYDLCPPDPAKTQLVDRNGNPLNLVTDDRRNQIGPLVTTSWIPAGNTDMQARAQSADQRLGTRTNQITLGGGHATPPITNVVGWGAETEVRCVIDRNGGVAFNPTVRNRPVGDEKDGDGTVALKAAEWLTGPTVQTFYVPIGVYPTRGFPDRHPRIWDSPPVEEIFPRILEGRTAEPYVWASADSDQALDRNTDVTIRIVAQDVNGGPLPNAQATLRTPNPVQIAFNNEVRANVSVRRRNMRPNVGSDLFRFTIDVTWGANGRKELPILIRV